MRNVIRSIALAAPSVCLLLPSPALSQDSDPGTVFRNPQNSVHVRIHRCGKSRCGTVVWANARAKADSARGGTPNLVGTELFRDFREVTPTVWKGKVFVPDLNMVFAGSATLKDKNTVIARGCLLGNIVCKSQAWTRVP